MKTDKTNAPNLEQRCPACSGAFTISPGSRRRKVQCPHCREVVTLLEPAAVPAAPESVRPVVPEWLARCEALQARVEALEQQVEALLVSPRPHAALLPDHFTDLRPGSRDHAPPTESAEISPPAPPAEARPPRELSCFAGPPPVREPEPAPAFMRNFQLPATPEIRLLVAAGDDAAHRVAASLSDLLTQTGWKVRAVTQDVNVPPGDTGLTLAAAPALPVQRVTRTLHALRTAGFAVIYQLDPSRGPGEATLTVGAGARAS